MSNGKTQRYATAGFEPSTSREVEHRRGITRGLKVGDISPLRNFREVTETRMGLSRPGSGNGIDSGTVIPRHTEDSQFQNSIEFIDCYGFSRSWLAEQRIRQKEIDPSLLQRCSLSIESARDIGNSFRSHTYYEQLSRHFASEETPFPEIITSAVDSLAAHTQSDLLRARLSAVLALYAHRNPIASCSPSLGPIATVACVATQSEESAFWSVAWVVEALLPQYFDSQSLGLLIDTTLLRQALQSFTPKLHKHFADLKMNVWMTIGQWLSQGFADVLPNTTIVRLWNEIMRSGNREMLLQIAFAILVQCQEQLLESKDGVGCVSVLVSEAGAALDFASLLAVMKRGDLVPSVQYIQQATSNARARVNARCRSLTSTRVTTLLSLRLSMDVLELLFDELMKPRDPDSLISAREVDEHVRANGIVMPALAQSVFDIWGPLSTEGVRMPVSHLLASLSLITAASPEYRLRMCFAAFDRGTTGFLEENRLRQLFYSPHWRLLLAVSSSPAHTLPALLEAALIARYSPVGRGLVYAEVHSLVFGSEELFCPLLIGFREDPVVLWSPDSLRPRWVPNNEARRCLQCGRIFSLTTRRHHCRQCGHVFCAKCTSNRRVVPGLEKESDVRVCDGCCLDMVGSMAEMIALM